MVSLLSTFLQRNRLMFWSNFRLTALLYAGNEFGGILGKYRSSGFMIQSRRNVVKALRKSIFIKI